MVVVVVTMVVKLAHSNLPHQHHNTTCNTTTTTMYASQGQGRGRGDAGVESVEWSKIGQINILGAAGLPSLAFLPHQAAQ